MLGRRTKRQVVGVAKSEIPGSCHDEPPVPVWRVDLECGHYVNLSRKKHYHQPDSPRRCGICRSKRA